MLYLATHLQPIALFDSSTWCLPDPSSATPSAGLLPQLLSATQQALPFF